LRSQVDQAEGRFWGDSDFHLPVLPVFPDLPDLYRRSAD
jgi:hypothetical protein